MLYIPVVIKYEQGSEMHKKREINNCENGRSFSVWSRRTSSGSCGDGVQVIGEMI